MGNGFRAFAFSAFFLIFAQGMHVPASADSHQRPNVLVLHSYHKGLSWVDDQTAGIVQTFNSEGLDVMFHVEYMDWKFNPTQENLRLRYEQYKLRYAGMRIDLVLTTDDAALSFALRHRAELFPDAPLVFNGVLRDSAKRLTAGHANLTGVYEQFNMDATVKLIRRFDPGLDTVYLLYDNSESGLQAGKLMAEGMKKDYPGISLVHLNSWTISDIIQRLSDAHLPPHTAVLANTYSRDAAGTAMEMHRFVKMISASSNAPVYILYDFDSGFGAVGGCLVGGFSQGEMSAKLGARILKGEKASDIPFSEDASLRTVIDYSQVLRYGISPSLIPDDAEIINRPESFFSRYRVPLLAASTIFFVMAAFIALLIVNVRQRSLAQKSLVSSRDYLDKVINVMADPLFVKDVHHRFVLVNDAFMEFTGYRREDIIGTYDGDVYNPEEAAVYHSSDDKVLTGGGANVYFATMTVASGITHYISTKKTLYVNEQGEKFVVGVIRDMTREKESEDLLHQANDVLEEKVAQRTRELARANEELVAVNREMSIVNEALRRANQNLGEEVNERKKVQDELSAALQTLREAQDQLVQSGKLAAIGTLVAGVAHEINTPLGNSVMAATFLEKQLDQFQSLPPDRRSDCGVIDELIDEQKEGVKVLVGNLSRAAELVRSFKSISVSQMIAERQTVELRSVFEDIVMALSPQLKKTRIRMKLSCPEAIEWDCFPGVLSQVVTNLVMNSIEHAFSPDDEGNILLDVRRRGSEIVFNYSDDGRGMTPEVREKVFDPFFTTARGKGGTGLGMYIVYNLVTQKLGGKIVCVSAPGEGTSFIMRLPLVCPEGGEA